MKISCQSCGTKYTIADEKVSGKLVKIRCKKCDAFIVADGKVGHEDPFDAPTTVTQVNDTETWMINVSDGDQRTVGIHEIAVAFANKVINGDTYCWKEGMSDWRMLKEIESLAAVVGLPSQPDELNLDAAGPELGSTAKPADAASERERFPEVRATPEVNFFPQETSAVERSSPAARRTGGRAAGSNDLFANADALSREKGASPTGRRNENSVLFSLESLTSKASATAKSSVSPAPASEASGLIDIRTLSQATAGSPKRTDKPDDIMNMGGGGAFAPVLAAPLLSTPSSSHIPSPFGTPGLTPQDPALLGSHEQKQKSANKTILFVVGILGICGLGAAAIFAFAPKADQVKVPNDWPQAERKPTPTGEVPTVPAAASVQDPTKGQVVLAPASTVPVLPATKVGGAIPKNAANNVGNTSANSEKESAEASNAKTKPATPAPQANPPKSLEQAMREGAGASAPVSNVGGSAPPSTAPFSRGAAQAAIGAVNVQSCKKADGPTGPGHVQIVFSPDGSVRSAVADSPPYQGTSVGGCVAAKFRAVRIPAFSGGDQAAGKSFVIN